jgi:16S rRNA (adenine1518-N6/adenine1519-N6)-dimethyltransferase
VLQINRRSNKTIAADDKKFFRLVKAGFSSRRKQLKNSLGAGLHLTNAACSDLLNKAQIDGSRRAQELSIVEWADLYKFAVETGIL